MRPLALMAVVSWGCTGTQAELGDRSWHSHGPIAEGISAPLGEPRPDLNATDLATFARGQDIAERRFTLQTGLGPAFNVSFCAACHEKPVTGGSAGLYRNFFIAATLTEEGLYFPTLSAGNDSGVVRMYHYGSEHPPRPAVEEGINVVAQRNGIPFFGVGLIAELSNEDISLRADPDDADGDGISGRTNSEKGFIGRFGRKSQTASIEGFIRGPLFNHMGVTTDPLCAEQRAALPVDSSGPEDRPCGGDTAQDSGALGSLVQGLLPYGQAAANGGPLEDDDGVPDPELSGEELFDLISFAMLLAAPEVEDIRDNPPAQRGQAVFDTLGCGGCHTPRLEGPRGPLPLYSDLLIHDMGPGLADGLQMGEAEGNEFRTQPLWGLAAVGPYLHDGRAHTIQAAIEAHGGEAASQAQRYRGLSAQSKADLETFLKTLGGASQASAGLLVPDAGVPLAGTLGGPRSELDATDAARFAEGQALFDREFGLVEGLGAPRYNGDSCRACHFEPVLGGSGPPGVNVMRHGITGSDGRFVPPTIGTILHKETRLGGSVNAPQAEADIFEHRNTPHLFGLGEIEGIDPATILARADPEDLLPPAGISGRASWTDGGELGRFGWKGQVPNIEAFVRDAVGAELGMSLPHSETSSLGFIHDDDGVEDPEFSAEDAALLAFYLTELGPPPRAAEIPAQAAAGESVFDALGCADCHVPSLEGAQGPVPLYSDLLLHAVAPAGDRGIEDASAAEDEFRTPPLWGLRHSAPYLHDGSADTLTQAIEAHAGEADASVSAWTALDPAAQAELLAFLVTL